MGSGVEPAPRMAALARQRGIHVTDAVAEALPFPDDRFALTAFITSLCFVTDPPRALAEASRVTRPGGSVLIAYLNLASAAGAHLAATQHEDPYFAHARLRTTTELRALLADADLAADGAQQVIAEAGQPPRVSSGADQGLFCVLRARVASTTKPPR
ncbi:class I SAM-dependent methyltransferase [Intrasporangium chromatireducens]|uniref:class I SAM-dependent methyltransferase n=1 Tax=Intrasporangium chromatireducens TaxID=1386088 RepID=UPI0023E4120F|nr:class I SAM-dependent methyltransferase [Intrasporangium chromatireducens]